MTTYEQDFYQWTQEQACLLRVGDYLALDIENLIEEVNSMGSSNKSSLRSFIRLLLMHLLKYQYQPEYRSRSWRSTIGYCRDDIADLIGDSPSLKTFTDEMIKVSYPRAVNAAAEETGIYKKSFPEVCPWTFEQITDADFFPNDD
jgi:hypothetical protein